MVNSADTPHAANIASKMGYNSNVLCFVRKYWLNKMMRNIVKPPIGQWRPASGAPNLNKDKPINAIVGAIVMGPIYFNIRPTNPLAPTNISITDPAIIAP